MIRVIMKMIQGLCTDFLAFALQPRKTSARRPSDEGAVRPVIASNGVPSLKMRLVRLHSMSGMEREGKNRDLIIGSEKFYTACRHGTLLKRTV